METKNETAILCLETQKGHLLVNVEGKIFFYQTKDGKLLRYVRKEEWEWASTHWDSKVENCEYPVFLPDGDIPTGILEKIPTPEKYQLPKPIICLSAYDYNGQGRSWEIFHNDLIRAEEGQVWEARSGNSHRECTTKHKATVIKKGKKFVVVLIEEDKVGGYPNFKEWSEEPETFRYSW